MNRIVVFCFASFLVGAPARAMAENIYLLCKESDRNIIFNSKALDIDPNSKSITIQDRPVVNPNAYFDYEDDKHMKRHGMVCFLCMFA
jgi:hypothetical protein